VREKDSESERERESIFGTKSKREVKL